MKKGKQIGANWHKFNLRSSLMKRRHARQFVPISANLFLKKSFLSIYVFDISFNRNSTKHNYRANRLAVRPTFRNFAIKL